MDLIAFGGISGKIGLLDSCTLKFKGLYTGYQNSEVTSIAFYGSECLLITQSKQGEIKLWDA
jgi:WD40 repeat protein